MIKAAIFDLDGTVIDSTANDYQAWKRIFEEYQVNFSYEEFIRVLGAKGSEIVGNHLDLDDDELESMLSRKETYFKEMTNESGLQTIPNVEKVLEEIRRIPLKIALATGTGKEKLEFIFKLVDIRKYFDVIITADDVEKGKPDAEVFLKAAEKLGVAPGESFVMEDATLGVKAAKTGGMPCIAITTTRGRDQLAGADLIIDHYDELNIQQWMQQAPRESGAS
jgi:beta-phosphoglucomutase family hydrolase